MPTYRDTIMIHDGRLQRAVPCTIDAPEDTSVVNIQELAEKTWCTVSKAIHIGGATMDGLSHPEYLLNTRRSG